jgi:hypothetical protein
VQILGITRGQGQEHQAADRVLSSVSAADCDSSRNENGLATVDSSERLVWRVQTNKNPRPMIRAINMWEQDAMRKLTTVFAVDQQIIRCEGGLKSAQSNFPVSKAAVVGWQRKLKFLARLKEHVATKS